MEVEEKRKKKAEDMIELDVMVLHSITATSLIEKLAELIFFIFDESGVEKILPKAKTVNVMDKLERNQQKNREIR